LYTNRGSLHYRSLDQSQYGDFEYNEWIPDISTGRIMGITLSDISSYLARDLFYGIFGITNNMEFMASKVNDQMSDIDNAIEMDNKFSQIGYNTFLDVHKDEDSFQGESSMWSNKDLISYADHGNSNWAGIYSWNIPLLSNSIIYNDACLTCSYYSVVRGESFCNMAIRQGALSHLGMVSVSHGGNPFLLNTMNGIYYEGLNLGQAFAKAYVYHEDYYMTMLLGDPTFDVNPPYMLDEPLQPV